MYREFVPGEEETGAEVEGTVGIESVWLVEANDGVGIESVTIAETYETCAEA
jgi:hypothetical protein